MVHHHLYLTDNQTYVLVTLPVHALANVQVGDQVSGQVKSFVFNDLGNVVAFDDQANDQAGQILDDAIHDKVVILLNNLAHSLTRAEISALLGLRNHSDTRKRYLDTLLHLGWIEMTFPESPTHPNQKYNITAAGNRILKLISPK